MDFAQADQRYDELKQQYQAGSLSADEFDAALKEMMVQDDHGRWWAKSRETGSWSYNDGGTWVRATPPVYQQPAQSAQPQPQAQAQPASVSSGLAIILYIVSFLVPLVGIILYFVYKGKPSESDRRLAKTALIVGLVSIGLYCVIVGVIPALS